jgi:mannosyltransferase
VLAFATHSVGVRRWPQIAILSAVALVTGVTYLGRKSLWFDEAYSIALARPSQSAVWHRFGGEINMALYHEILHFWLAVGPSAFDVRLLSVVFAVATIPLLYLLVEHLYGMREAMLSCALLAVSPLYVEFAQEARAYSLSLLFATALTVIFVHAVDTRSRFAWLAYGVVAGGSAYVHFFLGFVVLSHFISLVFLPRSARPAWTTLAPVATLIVALAAPVGYLAHRQRGTHAPISPKPGLLELVKIVKPVTGGSTLLAAVFLLAALLFLGHAWWRRTSEREWGAALVTCWLVVPVLGAWILSQDRSVWVGRYFIVSLPALVVAASVGSIRIRWRWLSAATLILLLVLSGRLVWRYYGDRYAKENWRDLAAYLASHAQSGDGLVVYAPFTRIALDHYLVGNARHVVVAPVYPRLPFSDESLFGALSPSGTALTERALGGISTRERRHRRIWVVLSHNREPQTRQLLSTLSGRTEVYYRDYAGVTLQLFAGP